MEGDEIRLLQELVDIVRLLHAGRQTPRRLDGDFGVEADDLHPELDGGIGDQAPSRAQPDDAEGAVRKLNARELLLALFDVPLELFAAGVEPGDIMKRRDHVPRGDQERRQYELLDRVGVGAWRVEDGNPAQRHLGHRNIVGSGTGSADRLHRRRNRHRVHIVRAHEDRVGMLDRLADRIASGREAMQPMGRDRVEREDLILSLSHGGARSPSCTRRACARPRSASRCRSTRACRRPHGGPSTAPCRPPSRP